MPLCSSLFAMSNAIMAAAVDDVGVLKTFQWLSKHSKLRKMHILWCKIARDTNEK